LALFLFFNANYFAPPVMTTARADGVRKAHLAAIAASDQVLGFQSVMSAPAVASSGSVFSLWMWGHFLLLSYLLA
jgi:hypothetical protein